MLMEKDTAKYAMQNFAFNSRSCSVEIQADHPCMLFGLEPTVYIPFICAFDNGRENHGIARFVSFRSFVGSCVVSREVCRSCEESPSRRRGSHKPMVTDEKEGEF